MRLIGHLDNENDARRLTHFLKIKGIETNCDGFFDVNTGHMSYHIWVYEEDRILEAQKEFAQFIQQPTHATYDIPITEQISPDAEAVINEEIALPRTKATPFTTFIIALCSLVFLLNVMEEYPIMREGLPETTFFMTPIQATLLFDLPPAFEKLEEIIQKHQIAPDQKVESLSPEILAEVKQLESTPVWRGAYDWVLLKIQGKDTSLAEGPMFYRILQGDVWRLFSPAILHGELLHILFNMIWVWVLCRSIEQKIGFFRLLVLTLVVGIGSNVAQYLMSGPFFIGYSGVVMGLAGFIWMREKMAPWEGYPLQRSTILFLLVFVGGMFLVQATSFVLQIFTSVKFSPNIANTAHISGALIGAFLGRFSLFAERVNR